VLRNLETGMDRVGAGHVDQVRAWLLRQMLQAKRSQALVCTGEFSQEILAAQITREVALALQKGWRDLLELLFDMLVKVDPDLEPVGHDHAVELHRGVDGGAAFSTGGRLGVC